MKTIKAACIDNYGDHVEVVICGERYIHHMKFETMLEATTFFDEIVNYVEWVYRDCTKEKGID